MPWALAEPSLTPRHLCASKAQIFTGLYGCWASVLPAGSLAQHQLLHPETSFSLPLSLCSGASTASVCLWVTVPRPSMVAGAPGARGPPARAAAARACRAPSGTAATPRKAASGTPFWEEPNAPLSPCKARKHDLATVLLPLSVSHSKSVPFAVISLNNVLLRRSED